MQLTWEKTHYKSSQSYTMNSAYVVDKRDLDENREVGERDIKTVYQNMLEPVSVFGFSKPVYVIQHNGREEIRYNTAHMELNRVYPVEWNGGRYGVRRTENDTELFRFFPDQA